MCEEYQTLRTHHIQKEQLGPASEMHRNQINLVGARPVLRQPLGLGKCPPQTRLQQGPELGFMDRSGGSQSFLEPWSLKYGPGSIAAASQAPSLSCYIKTLETKASHLLQPAVQTLLRPLPVGNHRLIGSSGPGIGGFYSILTPLHLATNIKP